MELKSNLKAILEERGISQKEFSQITGLRESTISEMCRFTKTVINISHLTTVAEALNITDLNLLFELKK